MAVGITTITNVSKQVVPILVNAISASDASSSSNIPAGKAEQMQIAPNSEFSIETRRIDLGQLEQLKRAGLIIYTNR